MAATNASKAKAEEKKVEETTPVSGGSRTMTAEEYQAYSKANGRSFGREEGTKTVLTTQELRVLINAKWTPDMIKDKHGLEDEELKQVVWALSKEERRDKPIDYNKHGFRL